MEQNEALRLVLAYCQTQYIEPKSDLDEALSVLRASPIAQPPLLGHLVTEDGNQFVDFVMPGDAEGLAAYRNAAGVSITEVAERQFATGADARDAARWRMLPAFFEEYQINALKLLRDIDAAIQQDSPT
ncbi:hypothetical protein [Cupriavidus oxalaticus]|uniref:hypothetical protein n=1 Tax=Cupriavidus oxalaticus TaxID=96344 RepID=UPI003177226E